MKKKVSIAMYGNHGPHYRQRNINSSKRNVWRKSIKGFLMKINVDIPTSLCFVTSNYCLIFTVEINLIIRSLGRLSVVKARRWSERPIADFCDTWMQAVYNCTHCTWVCALYSGVTFRAPADFIYQFGLCYNRHQLHRSLNWSW